MKNELKLHGFITRNKCLRNYISRLSAIIFVLRDEGFAEIRKQKAETMNKAIEAKIQVDKCPNCQGKFKQSRSGSSVVVCLECKKKYKYKTIKK